MIVVVEGVSAAGKTTWCATHAGRVGIPVINELPPTLQPEGSPDDIARFWTSAHCRRWAEAIRLEATEAIVVCDTDPLKLHYTWCLWRAGQLKRTQWRAAVDAHRDAIRNHEIGFADRILFLEPDPQTVRRQKEADATRRRRNFEQNLAIGSLLRAWYEQLDRLSPGRVVWQAERINILPAAILSSDRFDIDRFNALVQAMECV